MQTKAMRRSVVALAAGLFAVSTCAFADMGNASLGAKRISAPPALSDAQLDQVTAAGALSGVTVFNPGKANVLHFNRNMHHSTCVNCFDMTTPAGTSGATGVFTPNGKMTVHPIRTMPF